MTPHEKGPLAIFYERLYLVLIVTGVAAVCAYWMSLSMPAVYRAQARSYLPLQSDAISVTSEEGNLPSLPKLPTASDTMHDAMLGALQGGDLLEEVAAQVPDRSREQIRANVDFAIDAFNLVVITVYDSDPIHARDIAGLYLEGFRRKLDVTTKEIIRANLSTLDMAIDVAVEEVVELTEERLALLEGRGSIDFSAEYREALSRAAALRQEIEQIELNQEALRLRREALIGLIAARPEESMVSRSMVMNPRIDSLQSEAANANLQLAALLSKYREEHPEVKAQRRLLEILETGVQEEQSQPTVEGSRTYSPDPLRNEYLRTMGEVELDEAELIGRRAGLQPRYEEIRASLVGMPRFKAELELIETELRTAKTHLGYLRERRNEQDFYLARETSFLITSELPVLSAKPHLPRPRLNAAVAAVLGFVVSLLLVVLRTKLTAQREARLW